MSIRLADHFNYKRLIHFTLPTIIMMIFTSIYGVVDGLFVSNIVGSQAFAAINLVIPATMILGSFGFMVGTGGSALVSLKLGEGERKRANEIFSMLIYLLIILGIALALIGIPLLSPVVKLMGATDDMLPDCIIYGTILLIALPAFMLQNSFQSFLVVAEKPRMGLWVSIASGLTNMFFDFLLIYVFHMGVLGAALATVFSQIAGALIPLIYFIRKNHSPLKLVKTKFELGSIWKTCTNGSSEMVTNISMSLISMLYNWQLMRIAGESGVVAYGIIMYAGFIFSGTYIGYSIGTAPIISYHYGAGNHEELKNLLKRSLVLLSVTAIILTILSEVSAGLQAKIFVSYDLELMDFTKNAIRLYSVSYLLSEINIFVSSFFTALNNGMISATLSFLRTFVFLIIAIFTAPIVLGVNGIWLAVVFAESFSLIISIICLFANRKRYQY